jgi:hypothetical protein
MEKPPLTEEQKAHRAAVARANGAKSRGPKTPTGKYISSLNSIVTGENLGKLEADLPSCMQSLTIEDKAVYRRLLQINTRHMQPQSEAELEAIRHLAFHQFELKRLERIQETLRQIDQDKVRERHPDCDALEREAHGYKIGIADDKVYRTLNRDRRSHEISVLHYQKVFRSLRRDTPLVPPEPVSVAAEMQPDEPELPSPAVVNQALQHAARAESEPSFALAPWIRRFLQDKDLMEKVARRDNRELVDGRLVIPRLPRAA